MTYACFTSENAADTHLLKLQRLQNRVLRAIKNLDRCTSDRELHVAFKIPGTGQGEARHRMYKRIKLGDGQAYDRSVD
jgi:hypothetical protein